MPVASTPSRSLASAAPSASHTSAKTKGLDTLWIENGTSASPMANDSPCVPVMQRPYASAGVSASAGM